MLVAHENAHYDRWRALRMSKHDLKDYCNARAGLHKLDDILQAHHWAVFKDYLPVMTTAKAHAPLDRVNEARSSKKAVYHALSLRSPMRAHAQPHDALQNKYQHDC